MSHRRIDLARWRTRDEEPLVNAGINRGWVLVLASGDAEGARILAVWRVLDGGVGAIARWLVKCMKIKTIINSQSNVTWLGLAGDEFVPRFGAFTNNIHGVLLVLTFSREGKLVLGLAIRDLVD